MTVGSPIHQAGRAFDGVVNSYNQLAATVLQTLHFEARCRVIRSVGRTMQATYQLEPTVNEPDPEIVNLNADLVAFDEDVLTHLPVRQHEYVAPRPDVLRKTFSLTDDPGSSPTALACSWTRSSCTTRLPSKA